MLSLVVGFTSCNKDDDESGGNESCTFTYMEDGVNCKISIFENGMFSYSNSEGDSYTYNWKTDDQSYFADKSWDEIKFYVKSKGGTCN